MKPQYILLLALLLIGLRGTAQHQPEFSTAGFFELEQTGRNVYSMNPAWRFFKGEVAGAEAKHFDDSQWQVVSLPNGIEYLPTEASGCVNYRGVVWYRKHFSPSQSLKGKKLFLHFEAIMGQSQVYVNGKLLKEHFGGYLPIVVDVTDAFQFNTDNVIAVRADNSNNPLYPPGKPQEALDFTYFGGIYRDCWLIAHNNIYITDPNYENIVAGGGLFVSYDKVNEQSALVQLKCHLRNSSQNNFSGTILYQLQTPEGNIVASQKCKISVPKGQAKTSQNNLLVKAPKLWSPDNPELYNLLVRIQNSSGKVIDGYRKRIGIRSIEFKGADGFWLNGKPYPEPLIGANRHQDFAIVGNAVPNSIHWRDAKKLRDAGLKVIRNAHCPQDPAFMDACDELGLLVIVNTPGWQFWNEQPIFAERVYNDIRNLIRRDRSHPCVWLWEPILNETYYPAEFAVKALQIASEECPSSYSACDSEARGHEAFSVLFAHPDINGSQNREKNTSISYFTREWGDHVDDWSAHNSPSRVARNWGEQPMLVQANHYAAPTYSATSYDKLYRTSRQHMGGCLWHSFDHQRGYHPDPFYGGIMDVFRQPKYSYYMFKAQRPPVKQERLYETGPMVYIAHQMTPFSPNDVTVFSNCQQVRLTYLKNGKQYSYTKPNSQAGMPSPVILFKDVFNFEAYEKLFMSNKQADVYLLAEGLIDGKVVATHKVCPAKRPSKLLLWLDNENVDLQADGSDFVTVVAAVADNDGNIKRLNNYYVKFSIEGEGTLLGGADIMANPAPIRWGTAPILVQSTLKPGTIRISASVLLEGVHMPTSAVLEFESKAPHRAMIYNPQEAQQITSIVNPTATRSAVKNNIDLERERQQKVENEKNLKIVEKQQTEFGEKK